MLGGVGQPKLTKVLLLSHESSFAAVIEAIRSNAQMDGRVTLVLERPGQDVGMIASTEATDPEAQDLGEKESGFDWSPEIFR